MEPRSEFRIDPSMSPAGPLLPTQLFVELSGTVRLTDTVAESINREFGMLLFHLPPNPWTPMTQSSYRELQSTATFPGIVNLAPLGLPSAIRVVWRLQWLERRGQLRFGVLRCGEAVDMKSRAEASGILMRMQAARQSGELPALCKATAELPCGTQEALDVRVERIADALDLTSLDDDSGDTRGLMRQRHMYDQTPAIIELWSAGDYSGRTWILLEQDVIDRFGSLDLEAVQELLQPDITDGLRALAKSWNGVVIVNEQ